MLTVLLNALLLWYVWRQSDFAIFSGQLYVLIVLTLPVMCAAWCSMCVNTGWNQGPLNLHE